MKKLISVFLFFFFIAGISCTSKKSRLNDEDSGITDDDPVHDTEPDNLITDTDNLITDTDSYNEIPDSITDEENPDTYKQDDDTADDEAADDDVEVFTPPVHSRIGTGQKNTCFIDGTGDLYCFGDNSNAILGDRKSVV